MASASELLQKYGDTHGLSELALSELVRLQTHLPHYEPPLHANAKTLISLDGIPGAGKSATLAWLQPALGAEYFSMARFAEARGVSADERRQHQLSSGRAHPVDLAFLDALAASSERFLLLEKFPRTVLEAAELLKLVQARAWRFEVLHLQLPGDCVARSTQRQLERGPHRGISPEPAWARHRALVHLSRATSAREALRTASVRIHAFDMTRPAVENVRDIRTALGIDPSTLGWHLRPLEILERISRRLGIEAWVSSGSVYRPFWNNRFGPAQLPTDADVAVQDERHVVPLLRALEADAPTERWSVLCPATRLRQRHALEVATAQEAKAFASLLHRAGLARLHRGGLELQLGPGVEGALWSGTLKLNPLLIERLGEPQQRQVLAQSSHHLRRALSDYPGLQLCPLTRELLRGTPHQVEHTPSLVGSTWRALKTAVRRATRPSSAEKAFCRRALSPAEKDIALEILAFHQASDLTPEAPPLPPRGDHGPRSSTLELMGREASDQAFGEWILEQTHHHRPAGGADRYLRSVLDLSVFGGHLEALQVTQSPMHQGWSLDRHLGQSMLQLRTDHLLSRLKRQHAPEWLADLRLSMRLAMLFHDTGKLLGQRPRRHALISARLFARFRPGWFPARLVPLTQWLIRTHDLFGAFGRGLTEKHGHEAADFKVGLSLSSSYFGAMDSQAVRHVLLESGLPLDEAAAINRELWQADVGSIAALRWLLPVAALVERLLLAPHGRVASARGR
ncbi:MAG: hypothetical protein K1X89_03990 [Myxococcaceae bacterium]|nr:hypothetical protein [Myxococcaceae bacterium]